MHEKYAQEISTHKGLEHSETDAGAFILNYGSIRFEHPEFA
jgi:hypothetical protein